MAGSMLDKIVLGVQQIICVHKTRLKEQEMRYLDGLSAAISLINLETGSNYETNPGEIKQGFDYDPMTGRYDRERKKPLYKNGN